jgi:hypothetical protein
MRREPAPEKTTQEKIMATLSENQNAPLVNSRKWTTKVNIAVVISVIIVFIVGGLWLWGTMRHPEKTREQIDESVGRP